MRVTIKVEGLKECENALDELANATARNVLRRALMAAAAPVADEAQRRVPVVTGDLRDSVAVSTKLSKTAMRRRKYKVAAEVFAGPAGKDAAIAHLVEFGSAHNAPVGFLRNAVDARREEGRAIFLRVLRTEAEKALGRARRKAAKVLAASKRG